MTAQQQRGYLDRCSWCDKRITPQDYTGVAYCGDDCRAAREFPKLEHPDVLETDRLKWLRGKG